MDVDTDLARRIELAEAHHVASYASALAAMRPDEGAGAKALAGGVAVFAGPGSPLGKALAVGLGCAVDDAEIDEIERFLGMRESAVQIELAPFADPSLSERLAERRYRVVEFNHVLVRSLAGLEAGRAEIEVRAMRVGEEELWARTVSRGFASADVISEDAMAMALPSTRAASMRCMFAIVDGDPIGACGMGMHDGVVSLFGSSVLASHRRRGAQNAMIRERLAIGKEHGCDLATACTLPGTGSQRNFERAGFRVAYPKLLMQRM
jgi:ribosomal protein S18 acetylase RimI-like enzyme